MAFDFAAGLHEAGKSVAQTAQAYTLESQKAELEQAKVMLADQLAGAREEKGRAFTTSERVATQGFTGGENDKTRANQRDVANIGASAHLGAAATAAGSARYTADKHLEATKLTLEQGKMPPEVNFIKFLTDPATTPEQRALGLKIYETKNDKKETFSPMSAEDAKKALGDAYDSSKAYQRGAHGKIEPIGGSLVNITNQTEAGFSKQLGEQDAKRIGEFQENTRVVLDTAAKVQQVNELLSRTYTGPAGNTAQAFFKALGAIPGFEKYADSANVGTAAQAIISELTPRMRVPGSGATSDYEMRVFGAALPNLLNLPGGNELVSAYWQKIADRSLQIQGIAEKYAREKKALTGTDFSKEVAALGSLFSKDELTQMRSAVGDRSPRSVAAPPKPPSSPDARSIPLKADGTPDPQAMDAGGIYNTTRGVGRWNGKTFEPVQ